LRPLAPVSQRWIHELTTNAVKYGALSSPHGHVVVQWSLAAHRLTIDWVETGGPKPTAPTREGFGTKLIRSGVRQFDGSVARTAIWNAV
jgi:two-component sensor histidine kinase